MAILPIKNICLQNDCVLTLGYIGTFRKVNTDNSWITNNGCSSIIKNIGNFYTLTIFGEQCF
ncbi:MAG: hypothetical protein CMO80_16080 [Verrucomicrobiales bacterium]|nr:hypothetical protein [Verrucomicrobiales bacterium]